MSKVSYIQRYLLIIRLIRSNRYISMDKLITSVENDIINYANPDSIGTSERTIKRDLREIRNHFGISIEYSKANNGYYIPEDEDQQSDIERILEPFDLLSSIYAQGKLPSFVLPEKRKSKGTEHLHPLIHAIKNSYVVEFVYIKFNNTPSRIRTVEPYALKEFKGRWYLLAVETGGNAEIRTWGLDRIQNLNVTSRRFSKNIDLNVEKEFKYSFGIYSNKDKPVEEVVLSFAPKGGKYNDAFPLHESQETLIDNDREFRIRLNVKITYDFIMELLSQSEDIDVIAPAHLRETMIVIYRDAVERLTDRDNK